MKIRTLLITTLGLGLLSTATFAQEEEKPTMYTYATYFYCDVAGQDRVDEIVKTVNAPVYDSMVKDGDIAGWGWLAHHTGGKWRRVQYHQASTIEGLFTAQDEMDKRFEAAGASTDAEFGGICHGHDDYIWQVEGGSSSDKRGKTGFSVYYMCDETKEERADEIFAESFAPILDKYVADGKLTSWGWSSHNVGGKYRRLQTMTAASPVALMKARGQLIEEMYPDGSTAGEEFTRICGSHADYIWDIQLEKSGS